MLFKTNDIKMKSNYSDLVNLQSVGEKAKNFSCWLNLILDICRLLLLDTKSFNFMPPDSKFED